MNSSRPCHTRDTVLAVAGTFDPIALIEVGYQPHETEGAWLQALIDIVVPAMDPGSLGGIAYYMGARGPEHIRSKTLMGTGLTQKESVQMLTRGLAASTPEELQQVALASRKPGIHSLVEVAGAVPAMRWPRCPIAIADSLALTVPAPHDQVAILSTVSPARRAITASERALWGRICLHLGAGSRLVGRARDANADDVEGIVTPRGTLVHAKGVAQRPAAGELLGAAAKHIERARTKRGRSDPMAALDVWQGLLAGRWSMVEHVESDGKRLLLARRNDPDVMGPGGLSHRQRQAVFYASLGLTSKEIGYALGLSANTVGAHLAAGLRKLKIRTRAELVGIATELAMNALARSSPSSAVTR